MVMNDVGDDWHFESGADCCCYCCCEDRIAVEREERMPKIGKERRMDWMRVEPGWERVDGGGWGPLIGHHLGMMIHLRDDSCRRHYCCCLLNCWGQGWRQSCDAPPIWPLFSWERTMNEMILPRWMMRVIQWSLLLYLDNNAPLFIMRHANGGLDLFIKKLCDIQTDTWGKISRLQKGWHLMSGAPMHTRKR